MPCPLARPFPNQYWTPQFYTLPFESLPICPVCVEIADDRAGVKQEEFCLPGTPAKSANPLFIESIDWRSLVFSALFAPVLRLRSQLIARKTKADFAFELEFQRHWN